MCSASWLFSYSRFMEVELQNQMAHAFLSLSIFSEDCVSLHSHQAGHERASFLHPHQQWELSLKNFLFQANRQKMASQFNLHFFDYKSSWASFHIGHFYAVYVQTRIHSVVPLCLLCLLWNEAGPSSFEGQWRTVVKSRAPGPLITLILWTWARIYASEPHLLHL